MNPIEATASTTIVTLLMNLFMSFTYNVLMIAVIYVIYDLCQDIN
jgi:hypothetical protein